jgi:hypothetical protein
MVAEEEDRDGSLTTAYSVKVSRYIRGSTAKGLGIVGQPTAQNYFHRPLSVLLGVCFNAGFVLDGLEEPAFEEGSEATRPLGWANYWEIPPVLVCRMRLAQRPPE